MSDSSLAVSPPPLSRARRACRSRPTHAAIAKGTAEFKRSNRALFFGGFSTFSLLYCIQPLFPAAVARNFI